MAEITPPPAVMLNKLIASYPQLNDVSPSSWIVWSDNPKIAPQQNIAKICHADMKYAGPGFNYLATAVPKANKVSLNYLRMLIHGPFKAFSDLISLVKLKPELYYLQCEHLEKWPAPVLYNFCIASRVPIEFEHLLPEWGRLVGEGYPEVLAFLLSQSMAGKKFKDYREYPLHGHNWFDASADWKQIIAGSPHVNAGSYKDSPIQCTPSNYIWGTSKEWDLIRKLSDIEVLKQFGFKLPDKRKPKTGDNEFRLHWEKNMAYIAPPLNAADQLAVQQAQQDLNNMAIGQPNFAQWVNNIQMPPPPAVAVDPIDEDYDFDEDDFPDFNDEDLDDL